MKRLRLYFFLSFGLFCEARAATNDIASFAKEKTVRLSADEIIEILTDFENFCDKGCLYEIEGLKAIEVLEMNHDSILVWQSIDGVQPQSIFFQVNFIRNQQNLPIRVIFTYPSVSRIAELEKTYDLAHDTLLKGLRISYELTEKIDDQGESYTFVKNEVWVQSKILESSFGRYMVLFQLKQSADKQLGFLQ